MGKKIEENHLEAIGKDDLRWFENNFSIDFLAATGSSKRNLLHICAIDDAFSTAKFLLEKKININAKDSKGYTALHFSVQKQSIEFTKLLLSYDPNIESKDKHGNTPLAKAIFYYEGNHEIIELLLDKGADLDSINNYGVTPRSLAGTIANYDLKKYINR